LSLSLPSDAGHATASGALTSHVRTWLVSGIFILSFMSYFQPAPTDYMFVLAVLACLTGGLRFSLVMMPLMFLLLIYNLAGVISYMMVPFELGEDGKQYLFGLAYTSFSGLFFAAYIAEDPLRRMEQITKAYWVGATIGAVLGLIGYFEIKPVADYLPQFNARAVGAYKDPNVYSTWLVYPAVTMVQGFLMGTLRMRPLALISFLLIFAALFLSFSRGAWINTLMSIAIVLFLTFALAPSRQLRVRITLSGLAGFLVFALILTVLLSIPETRETFLDRFTLVKSYDAGETGRFGNQLNSIPLLIERPLGLGPYQFGVMFGLAPHNTFLNSFASAGWLGGISFIVFVVSSFVVGARLVVSRTPFQTQGIAAFACFVAVTFQGVQIDTEHWRHLYWMVGMVWGLYAASLAYSAKPMALAEIYKSWNLPPQKLDGASS
jgi:hypothetical protein